MPELSKREKKIARMLVDKGVEAEFGAAVKQVDEIIAEWKNSNLDNRMAYKTILKKMKDHDKHIANRHDSLRG